MSDQLDTVQEEVEEEKDVEEEEEEVERGVSTTTTMPDAPLVLVIKQKYPVVLPYVRGMYEQLRSVF